MAHFPKAHLIFTVPVLCLIAGGALTLVLVGRATASVPITVPSTNVREGLRAGASETHGRDAHATAL